MDNCDYYQLFHLSQFATSAQIKSAYSIEAKKLSHLKTSHPDYVQIKKAYDVLSDNTLRKQYDNSRKSDPYKVLSVAKNAGLREIIVSYRKLARVHHPDKGGNLLEFDRITEAYRVLSDPHKRSDYDRNGFSAEELELPNVVLKQCSDGEKKGRCVVADRDLGMGEVLLSRERPFSAVLSGEEGAYQGYCHNCFVSLRNRRTKEKCDSCSAHYCSKVGCGLHCERHQRECFFTRIWKESDLCRFSVYDRPTDKMLFLIHAVYNGGLIFTEATLPVVPIKSTPLQLQVNELCDNLGDIDPKAALQNLEYAEHVADFLQKHGGLGHANYKDTLRELIKLLRYYDANAVDIVDNVVSRPIAKSLYLSISLFNHSCSPNCAITFEGDCATVRTIRHVEKGEELEVCYVDSALPKQVRQSQLKQQWCFQCKCVKCESSMEAATEALLHGTFCPNENCRAQLLPTSSFLQATSTEISSVQRNGDALEAKGDQSVVKSSPSKQPHHPSSSFSPLDSTYRPSPLSVNSVPYLDQCFLPSIAGYLGEKTGYQYQEGQHGLGYYQLLDNYGYPIQERGDSLGVYECVGCKQRGVDIYLQKSLLMTCERHKFFHTHKQSVYDIRIAAFETAQQLRQVLHLELSCLHPFHPSVIETMRCLYRMFAILEQNEQCIRLLRVIATRDEVIYGVVSQETAQSSKLLAIAYFNLSHSTNSLEHVELAIRNIDKSQHIMSVIFGRNHEVTMSTSIMSEMIHNRMECLQEGLLEKKMLDDKDAALLLVPTSVSDGMLSSFPSNDDEVVCASVNIETSDLLLCPSCGTSFHLPLNVRLAPCPECQRYCTQLDAWTAPGAATCGAFEESVTKSNMSEDSNAAPLDANQKQRVAPKYSNPTTELLESVLEMIESVERASHQVGDVLPSKAPHSMLYLKEMKDAVIATESKPCFQSGVEFDQATTLNNEKEPSQQVVIYSELSSIPKLRVSTPSIVYFDDNMKCTINSLKVNHMNEWYPCAVCSKPRASKRCSGCKVIRYCSMECAKVNYSSHKTICSLFKTT